MVPFLVELYTGGFLIKYARAGGLPLDIRFLLTQGSSLNLVESFKKDFIYITISPYIYSYSFNTLFYLEDRYPLFPISLFIVSYD